ncbi:MAG: hypothetical protein FGM61_10015 [Sediminibacterium sp.]|nr:hypothetical protein [Sediminibacterium sp.]
MKVFFVSAQFFLLFISCQSNSSFTIENQTQFSEQDSIAIVSLMHSMYQWEDSVKHFDNFPLVEDASKNTYLGIDFDKQRNNETMLANSTYFSSQWITQYHQLASTIDSLLAKKIYEWPVGEMCSFTTDVNPWWEAQDVPENFPWSISIEAIQYDGREVSFLTRWWKDKTYAMRCIKEQGGWKISYLQGFDPHRFFIYNIQP